MWVEILQLVAIFAMLIGFVLATNRMIYGQKDRAPRSIFKERNTHHDIRNTK